MKKEIVILVNRAGRRIGVSEKLEAHRKGLLHRAFSIFLFNETGEMLLQQRATAKYHFGGLWSNACCSHPRPGEQVRSAAHRRLREELGIACPLKISGNMVYQFVDGKSGLTEHEFDYLFTGLYHGEVPFNRQEVMAVKWMPVKELEKRMITRPQQFTPWFRAITHQAGFFRK
jgi:isopentenyl-diphosphate delta-isomerase